MVRPAPANCTGRSRSLNTRTPPTMTISGKQADAVAATATGPTWPARANARNASMSSRPATAGSASRVSGAPARTGEGWTGEGWTGGGWTGGGWTGGGWTGGSWTGAGWPPRLPTAVAAAAASRTTRVTTRETATGTNQPRCSAERARM